MKRLLTFSAALLAVASPAAAEVEIRATLIALPEAEVLQKMLRAEFADDTELFEYAKAEVAAGRVESKPPRGSPPVTASARSSRT